MLLAEKNLKVKKKDSFKLIVGNTIYAYATRFYLVYSFLRNVYEEVGEGCP